MMASTSSRPIMMTKESSSSSSSRKNEDGGLTLSRSLGDFAIGGTGGSISGRFRRRHRHNSDIFKSFTHRGYLMKRSNRPFVETYQQNQHQQGPVGGDNAFPTLILPRTQKHDRQEVSLLQPEKLATVPLPEQAVAAAAAAAAVVASTGTDSQSEDSAFFNKNTVVGGGGMDGIGIGVPSVTTSTADNTSVESSEVNLITPAAPIVDESSLETAEAMAEMKSDAAAAAVANDGFAAAILPPATPPYVKETVKIAAAFFGMTELARVNEEQERGQTESVKASSVRDSGQEKEEVVKETSSSCQRDELQTNGATSLRGCGSGDEGLNNEEDDYVHHQYEGKFDVVQQQQEQQKHEGRGGRDDTTATGDVGIMMDTITKQSGAYAGAGSMRNEENGTLPKTMGSSSSSAAATATAAALAPADTGCGCVSESDAAAAASAASALRDASSSSNASSPPMRRWDSAPLHLQSNSNTSNDNGGNNCSSCSTPPNEFIDPKDGHVWRAKYCVLEDGVLYFYRNAIDADSPEAQRERSLSSSCFPPHELPNPDHCPQGVIGSPRANSPEVGFGTPILTTAAGTATATATAAPPPMEFLAKSPMARRPQSLQQAMFVSPRSNTPCYGHANSFGLLQGSSNQQDCHDGGVVWEKRVALSTVGAVRSAEEEFGECSFVLLTADEDSLLGGSDCLVLRTSSTEEMTEWMFQFHRSISCVMKRIVDCVGFERNGNDAAVRRGTPGVAGGGGSFRVCGGALLPPESPGVFRSSGVGGTGAAALSDTHYGYGASGSSTIEASPLPRYISRSTFTSPIASRQQQHQHQLAPSSAILPAAPTPPLLASLSHGHGRNGLHRRRTRTFNGKQRLSSSYSIGSSMGGLSTGGGGGGGGDGFSGRMSPGLHLTPCTSRDEYGGTGGIGIPNKFSLDFDQALEDLKLVDLNTLDSAATAGAGGDDGGFDAIGSGGFPPLPGSGNNSTRSVGQEHHVGSCGGGETLMLSPRPIHDTSISLMGVGSSAVTGSETAASGDSSCAKFCSFDDKRKESAETASAAATVDAAFVPSGKYLPPHLRKKMAKEAKTARTGAESSGGEESAPDPAPASAPAPAKYIPPHLRRKLATPSSKAITTTLAPHYLPLPRMDQHPDDGAVGVSMLDTSDEDNNNAAGMFELSLDESPPQCNNDDENKFSCAVGATTMTNDLLVERATTSVTAGAVVIVEESPFPSPANDTKGDVNVRGMKLGGCADPLISAGSIMDQYERQENSNSNNGLARTSPYGVFGGGSGQKIKKEDAKRNIDSSSSTLPRPSLKWEVGAVSECGVRDSNEDAYLIVNDLAEAFRGKCDGSSDSVDEGRDGSNGLSDRGKHNEATTMTSAADGIGLFAIFDGHCGTHAARFAAEKLAHYLEDALVDHDNCISARGTSTQTRSFSIDGGALFRGEDGAEVEENHCLSCITRSSTTPASAAKIEHLENSLMSAIAKTDDEFCKLCTKDGRDWESGSTALVTLVCKDFLIVANLGDCRGVICCSASTTKNTALTRTKMSKANDHVEKNNSKRTRMDTELEAFTEDNGWISLPENDAHDWVGGGHKNKSDTNHCDCYDNEDIETKAEEEEEVGEAMAALNQRYYWKEICDVHSPSRLDEKERILQANGWITIEQEVCVGQLQRLDLYDEDVVDILQRCFADRFDELEGESDLESDEHAAAHYDEGSGRARKIQRQSSAAPGRLLKISRTCGELSVSRALGDKDFKSKYSTPHPYDDDDGENENEKRGKHHGWWQGPDFLPYPLNHKMAFRGDLVSAIPEIQVHSIGHTSSPSNRSHSHHHIGEEYGNANGNGNSDDGLNASLQRGEEFVLLACDGLWDVMDMEDAVRVSRDLLYEKKWEAKKAAARLAELAIHLGSSDNVTVILIRFFRDDNNDDASSAASYDDNEENELIQQIKHNSMKANNN